MLLNTLYSIIRFLFSMYFIVHITKITWLTDPLTNLNYKTLVLVRKRKKKTPCRRDKLVTKHANVCICI